MTDYKPIVVKPPATVISASQIAYGPPIDAISRIRLYSSDDWEAFTNEWAFSLFEGKEVIRFTGAGDRGVDIAVFDQGQDFFGIWDGYQCKHYGGALTPTDVYVELGKVIWYSYSKQYAAPRSHTFIAPCGIGTKLNNLLKSPDKLRQELISNWAKHCQTKITDTQVIPLEAQLLAYINAFDFEIFRGKQPLALVEEHRKSPYHLTRFGGGFPARPGGVCPPDAIAPEETKYVTELYSAYANHLNSPVTSSSDLSKQPLKDHFARQREAFYQAEALRVFVRDKVEPGTFERLQDEIFNGVIDTHDEDYADGYRRVVAVTKAAQDMVIVANPVAPIAQTQDRRGICHQLVNDDRLKWTK